MWQAGNHSHLLVYWHSPNITAILKTLSGPRSIVNRHH